MDKKVVDLITESEKKGFCFHRFLSKVLSQNPEDGDFGLTPEEQDFVKRFKELSDYKN